LYTTIPKLNSVLCSEWCSICGEFGGFMTLPTCSTCCSQCIELAPELHMMTHKAAEKQFGIDRGILKVKVPVLRTVPGVYCWEKLSHPTRLPLVSAAQAQAANDRSARSTHAQKTPKLHPSLGEVLQDCYLRFMRVISLPYLDTTTRKVQSGVSCKGYPPLLESRRITRSGIAEAYERRDRTFSQDEFVAHF
jgi:hypothetical protein